MYGLLDLGAGPHPRPAGLQAGARRHRGVAPPGGANPRPRPAAQVSHVQPMPVDTTGWGWNQGGKGILVVARLTTQKRVDLAITAAARLGVPCVVVGDGPERPALEALARARRGFEFTGALRSTAVRERLLARRPWRSCPPARRASAWPVRKRSCRRPLGRLQRWRRIARPGGDRRGARDRAELPRGVAAGIGDLLASPSSARGGA